MNLCCSFSILLMPNSLITITKCQRNHTSIVYIKTSFVCVLCDILQDILTAVFFSLLIGPGLLHNALQNRKDYSCYRNDRFVIVVDKYYFDSFFVQFVFVYILWKATD